MNFIIQVRKIVKIMTIVVNSDLNKKIVVKVNSEIFDFKNTINIIINRLGTFAFKVSKVTCEVGTDRTFDG
jgi:osomolarity two-component system sensor histidine kinase NIK1